MPYKLHSFKPRQAKLVKALAKGNTITDSMRIAGYSDKTDASQLLKRESIKRALIKAGLTEDSLSKTIRDNIEAGTGVKATADTALRGVELALRLMGHLDSKEDTGNTTNVYINELRAMDTDALKAKLKALEAEIVTTDTTTT